MFCCNPEPALPNEAGLSKCRQPYKYLLPRYHDVPRRATRIVIDGYGLQVHRIIQVYPLEVLLKITPDPENGGKKPFVFSSVVHMQLAFQGVDIHDF